MRERVEISSGGMRLTGWSEFTFTSGVDKTASSFSMSTTRSPQSLTPPSVTNSQVEVRANGDLLMTGHIEKYDGELDVEGGRSLTISGRSLTSTIVDSDTTGHFIGLTGIQIIRELVREFGIEVETNISDWRTHPTYTVESGSKVKDAIFHVLRMQKATVTVTPEGRLRIWRSEDRRSQGGVSTGNFIKRASLVIDETKRFSEYQAKGQDSAKFTGIQASEIVGTARDTTSRLRRRIFFPEPESTTEGLREAAEKAARRSFGAAREVTLEVSGWRSESGDFWSPGSSLWVDLPEFDLSREMIIGDVNFRQSVETGTVAELSMKTVESLAEGSSDSGQRSTAAQRGSLPRRSSVRLPGGGTPETDGVHTTTILGGQ